MPDPTVDSSWITTILGGALSGGGVIGAWKAIEAWFGARKAEARTERKEARAEAAEINIVRRLEEQITRMQAEIDRLTKRVGEQDAKLEEFADRLAEAIDDRVKAIEEASRIRGDHVQLETRLTQEIAEHSALSRSHADLISWVRCLSLSDADRCSATYLRALSWHEHYRARLSDQAA